MYAIVYRVYRFPTEDSHLKECEGDSPMSIMSALSENVKRKLANALDDKNEAMFVADGKLVSLQVHDTGLADNSLGNNLAEKIEAYSKLKQSLQRFLDNPDMKRYILKELKEMRHHQRR